MSTNIQPLILADIRSFCYSDGYEALRNVSLTVAKGDFIGILGSNGSGKTTLLKVIDGIYKDFEGDVLLEGKSVKRLTPKQIYSKMGLVFQNPDEQLFASTVFEDVAFGPFNMGFAEDEINKRVLQALEAVQMADFANKPIHQLSYGQKKRICIAGLLSMGHKILLLDEPTAGLDPMGEYHMMKLLGELNKQNNVTIIMATHNVDLVPLFLDRLFILSKGTIARGGSPAEVFTAPEELEGVKLRLPNIAELIYKLKNEDKLPFRRVPLTIGEARREILQLFRWDKIN